MFVSGFGVSNCTFVNVSGFVLSVVKFGGKSKVVNCCWFFLHQTTK
jgi:hypothetical protein